MRRLIKMPPQIFRIVLLAGAIVGSYVIAREFLTPASFKQYGFYRGDALGELASREPVFAGKAECAACHDEQVKRVAAHGHKTLSCEGCHGPGQAHVKYWGGQDDASEGADKINPAAKSGAGTTEAADLHSKLTIPQYSLCVRCHEANVSRPSWHKQIKPKDHYPGACTECHIPHAPEEVP